MLALSLSGFRLLYVEFCPVATSGSQEQSAPSAKWKAATFAPSACIRVWGWGLRVVGAGGLRNGPSGVRNLRFGPCFDSCGRGQ